MRLFKWLRKLLGDLIRWIGEKAKVFLERLMWALQEVWKTVVTAALLAAFGDVPVLYVIFYAATEVGKTMMEVWDPKYYDSKPSEVFELQQAPQNLGQAPQNLGLAPYDSPLPTNRGEAKVLILENWS